jgi:hypothetical protein
MMQLNKKIIKNVKTGDLVLLTVPDVDRGPLDPSNLICLFGRVTYFVSTCRAGLLNYFYAFNSFRKCPQSLSEFTITDIPKVIKNGRPNTEYVSLGVREAIYRLSIDNGQGYLKCSCNSQCKTMRCSCKKAGITYSSKCHGRAFECDNKEPVPATTSTATTKKTTKKNI